MAELSLFPVGAPVLRRASIVPFTFDALFISKREQTTEPRAQDAARIGIRRSFRGFCAFLGEAHAIQQ
jgi:hypothetical protein